MSGFEITEESPVGETQGSGFHGSQRRTEGGLLTIRGRGFEPHPNNERVVGGLQNYPSESEDWGSGGDNFPRGEMRRNPNRGHGTRGNAKPKKPYIPPDPVDDEEELFNSGIPSGENFDRYENIDVHVIGDNPPNPINTFEQAGLFDDVLTVLALSKYRKPTPAQKHSIPILLSGRNLLCCAQTGTGKTAAFYIPIVQSLLNDGVVVGCSPVCKPQAVILSPTRELALQLYNEARRFTHRTPLKVCITYGGTSVFHQVARMSDGCHILVSTPGRLVDILSRGRVSFVNTRFFVLDEADKMLEMGFFEHMELILRHRTVLPEPQRAVAMFSATFPLRMQRLADHFLQQKVMIAVGAVGSACLDIEQRVYPVSRYDKRDRLLDTLLEVGPKGCLVFVARKRATDFLAAYLCEKDIPATSIHGDRDQILREEALRQFRIGKMDVLVATSVAARGLDIKNVTHVLNFDMPRTVDEYVHRIGRTGRLGNRGLAITFFEPDEDRTMAADLIRVLEDAEQFVPEFLRETAARGNVAGFCRYVANTVRDNDDPGKEQAGTAFEEELW